MLADQPTQPLPGPSQGRRLTWMTDPTLRPQVVPQKPTKHIAVGLFPDCDRLEVPNQPFEVARSSWIKC